jgi:hypothetical protein
LQTKTTFTKAFVLASQVEKLMENVTTESSLKKALYTLISEFCPPGKYKSLVN